MSDEKTFSSVKAVLAHLQESRKIKQAKLYADIRAGYLRRQKDGSFRQADVDRYASTLSAADLPERVTEDLADLARQEQEERVLKLREQRQSLAFDRALKEGKYIPRDDVALELAGRAVALSIGLRSALTVATPDLIAACGGDKDQADALVAELETHLDAALHEYSRPMVFDVAVEEDVQAEARHDD